MIKKTIVIAAIVVLVIGIVSYYFSEKEQPLTKADVKKEIMTVESTLLEASLLTQLAYREKTTVSFLKIHAQELSKQLQQSKQTLISTHATPDMQQQSQEELRLISQANQSLQRLSDNPNDSQTIKSTQKQIILIFKKQQQLEKSL